MCLEREATIDAAAKGLFLEVNQYRFIAYTHLMMDVLPFQQQKILDRVAPTYLNKIVDNLESRFQDYGVIDAMKVLVPENIAKCESVASLAMMIFCCERGFSTQNRIMSRLRTSMNNTTIDDLMRIFEDGPRMELFDFGKALRKWKKEKDNFFSRFFFLLYALSDKLYLGGFDELSSPEKILNLYIKIKMWCQKTLLIEHLLKTLENFSYHLFTARWQRKQWQSLAESLPKDHCGVEKDFSENFRAFDTLFKFIFLQLFFSSPYLVYIYNTYQDDVKTDRTQTTFRTIKETQKLHSVASTGVEGQRQTKRPGYRRLHEYRKGYDELDINTPAKRTKKSEVNKLYLIDILDEKIVDNMTYQKIHYIGYDNEEDEWRVKNDFVSLVRFDPDTVTDPTIKSDLIGLRNGLDNHLTNRAGKSHRVEFNTDCCEATFDYLKGLCNCAVQSEGLTVTKSDILNPAFGPDWIYRILNSAGDVCEISINSLRIKWMPGRLIKRFQYDEQQQVVERKILGASHIKIKFIRRDTKGTNLKKSHVAVALLERTLILEAAHVGEFTMLERLTTINEVNTRNQNVIEILCQLTFKELKGHLQKVCNKYKKFKDDKDCATFGSKNKVKQVGEEEEQIGRLKDSSELLTINYSLQRINVDMLHTQVNLKAYGNKPINVIGQVNCNIEFHERAENNSYWRRDSRTLAAAEKRGLNVPDNCELKCQLKYYEIKFSCVKGGRGYTSSSTGKRPHQSTFRAGCQSFIQVTYSKERHKLVIVNLNLEHNHAVNLSFR
ncbi:hypothetical protein GQR58_020932 [Nymphon striatum]|nr:hypothetical protein GQR58_020932 [Nymphon striatum]